MEVAPSIIAEDNRLAIDQCLVCGDAASRLGDVRKAIREVCAATAPDSSPVRPASRKSGGSLVSTDRSSRWMLN
jgi:hypothetical protein